MMRFEPGILDGTLTSKTLRDYCGQRMCQIVATTMKMLLTIRRRQMIYFNVYKERRRGKFNTQMAY